MSSSDDDIPIAAAAGRRRRRGTKAAKRQRDHDRDILRSPSYSPSYSPSMRSCQNLSDEEDYYRRSRSPARRRARTRRCFDDDDVDRRSRSRSPRRRRRARSNTYSDDGEEDEPDRRSRSRSPRRRRRARSNTYSDDGEEDEPDRRSRSPRRRAAPRSCRSQSRSRSEECEDRRCCPPRAPADDGDLYVRIDRTDDHLFKCARCHQLLPPPVVYECMEGHVTCASCHNTANGGEGERRCSQCGTSLYGQSPAVAKWLRSLRFSCRNYDHGCPSSLPRHEMEVSHEPTCGYAPVFCPVRRCGFPGGPADSLERHLAVRHGWAVDAFRYGEPLSVRVHPDPEPRSVLRAADDGELFYLRAVPERRGAALSMIRIRPDNAAAEAEFEYEVRTHAAAGVKHRLQMQSTVWATSLGNGSAADENPVSVRVPLDMLPVDGPERDSVEVRVRKVAPAAAARDN
ncbi:unnamed protein product [Urochloa decumbens]|uniref:SIAH-type domain-containing protein n=1 Tax=Urochloa decumbens TaxID=240449 RepID=A0ABC9HCM9_9POAL